MSWSVSAMGNPTAVASKLKRDLETSNCPEPEESIKTAAIAVIVTACLSYPPKSCVKVEAYGSQVSPANPINSLRIELSPVHGFVFDEVAS